ncbi:MAG: orotidine-5'-phosphate decarboxylase [Bacilli bacterium]|nr:orotidine-5'-phosphate decarboxylase [Bacilli bacterium]
MGKNVIIACDFNSKEKLERFLDQMEGADPNFYCKVGMELFDSGALQGFNPVQIVKERGHKVFLDLKLKDIPNTVSKTAKTLIDAGADMINLHADGGLKMLKDASVAVNEAYAEYQHEYDEVKADRDMPGRLEDLEKKLNNRPILLGVTVLTSMSEEELRNEIGINKTPMEQVVSLAKLCKEAGLDGVVCSPQEIIAVKEACGEDFITVTPGIRFADSKKDDQTRVATPACANILGSDYIVVGRPITNAENAIEAYNRCKKDFTEQVTATNEIKNAKGYIENLKKKIVNPSDVVAQKLIEASAFKVSTEDPFLLKSGLGAPIYLNNRDLYKSPAEQKLIMDYLAKLVEEYYPHCEAIFGTPMSAISFGALVAERLGLPFGFVRPEKKDHGIVATFEGPKKEGMKIVQIEDLITSGVSSLDSITPLKDFGADVLGIAAIVDNDFVPSQKLIDKRIEYRSITTMSKIVQYAFEQGLITEDEINQIWAYKGNPKDESWMSDVAKGNIAQKRLAKK